MLVLHQPKQESANQPAIPQKWTTTGQGGIAAANKQEWAQNNPCYLCTKFGHRSRDHKEMPCGPWSPAGQKRFAAHQEEWMKIGNLIDEG